MKFEDIKVGDIVLTTDYGARYRVWVKKLGYRAIIGPYQVLGTYSERGYNMCTLERNKAHGTFACQNLKRSKLK